MLRASSINMKYPGGAQALDNVSLTVPNGHIYCLLGSNGAGKSTLIHLFLDFIRPDSGNTYVDDILVQENPVLARHNLAYLPDQVELFEEMSGADNLTFFCRIAKQNINSNQITNLFDAVNLEPHWSTKKVGTYSRGMRQKLGLAILIGRNAGSFLMDEPTLGLDPQSSRDLVEVILKLKSENSSVLVSTHDLLRAQQIADTIGILKKGKLITEISKSDIAKIDLEKVYLEYLDYCEKDTPV